MPAAAVANPPWLTGTWATTVWESGTWGVLVTVPAVSDCLVHVREDVTTIRIREDVTTVRVREDVTGITGE